MREAGDNIILSTDSYKQSHWQMYPPDCEYVGSYLESRSGGEYSDTIFFGLQYLLDRYFEGKVVTREAIDEAADFCQRHFGQDLFNREGWEHILKNHDGRLPVEIKAVPEGELVPTSNVLLTIQNTDPKCPWVVNHLETLLVQLWYPCTVATVSRNQKRLLKWGLEKSGTVEKLPFMLHDFGYRGSTSLESAAIGGAAHLVNFVGSDTIAGMELLINHYDADMPAYSVPAAEHSTITSWGNSNKETDAFKNILQKFPEGIVSVVSDSWNIHHACSHKWGFLLKDRIENRPDRTLVVRPDSGNPNKIVPECLDILGERFGYTRNDKGYKVLPDYIRVIQGDGITRQSLETLIYAVMASGWSMDNVVFGSGGGLLQDFNRDTMRFAMKCNWVGMRDGTIRPVYKRPISDVTKSSKSGRLKLIADYMTIIDGKQRPRYKTVAVGDYYFHEDVLQTVFLDGEVTKRTTLDEVRERAEV